MAILKGDFEKGAMIRFYMDGTGNGLRLNL